ncbi:amidophosphoribosyltransferase-like isoform X3 [Vespa crabro]|uniref:amidophosphoribosyltransferase-like isoform X3 n=1 Tax=Vespa crabro TaxID=7445 RepID=UPI001F001E3F|nr:amidophosphoribosyltransferase-like isoform X3 [Vespa crabro]
MIFTSYLLQCISTFVKLINIRMSHDKQSDSCSRAISCLTINDVPIMFTSKDEGRSKDISGLTHECGVFGCIAAGDWPSQIDVSQVICLGLIALQHRGQESAGIVTSQGICSKSFYVHKVHTAHGALAVAHNGELVNTESLRKMVLGRGVGLSTYSDSELITQALCLNPPEGEVNGPDWPARIKHLMQLAPLSYSLVIMQRDKIYGVRDPYGNRPLCLGKIVPIGKLAGDDSDDDDEAEGWVISSESCGFLSIGARYVREVFPGEIVELTREGIKTIDIVERPDNKPQAFCIFEYVYFARSDSIFEGQMVYSVRMQCGRVLAIESPVDADIVSSVPESGTAAAHGYARQSQIPFAEVLCKNRYVGRTFIQPSTRLRQLGVAKKFGALSENVKGKKLILIDDSIVRGNTIGPIIKLLRDAGAKEVHIKVASPPLKYPCYMGINIPTREELIANKLDNVRLAKYVGADSLTYLSVKGLIQAVRHGMDNKESSYIGHCTACLTGEYPDELPGDLDW